MYYKKGVKMEAKNFSVGVRIEHLQSEINKSQYGTITKLKLPPAEYKMANDKKKMVEAITAQEVDFAQWYTDICTKAELVE